MSLLQGLSSAAYQQTSFALAGHSQTKRRTKRKLRKQKEKRKERGKEKLMT
jgi:CelD/BcsL family acetyltransferase involved in cellulose biosynthesis